MQTNDSTRLILRRDVDQLIWDLKLAKIISTHFDAVDTGFRAAGKRGEKFYAQATDSDHSYSRHDRACDIRRDRFHTRKKSRANWVATFCAIYCCGISKGFVFCYFFKVCFVQFLNIYLEILRNKIKPVFHSKIEIVL